MGKQAKISSAAMGSLDNKVSEKQKLIDKLEKEMESASTPEQKQKIQKQIKQLQDEQQQLQTQQTKMAAAAMGALDDEALEKDKQINELEKELKAAATPEQRQKIQKQLKQLQDE